MIAIFLIGLVLVMFGFAIGFVLASILSLRDLKRPTGYQPPLRIEEGGNVRLIRPRRRGDRLARPQAW